MKDVLPLLNSLVSYAKYGFIRYPILLKGSRHWSQELLNQFFSQEEMASPDVEVYGDIQLFDYPSFPLKKGRQKLGQESQYLVIDISSDFNANAINALCGTLVGGGVVFFVYEDDLDVEVSASTTSIIRWLESVKQHIIHINQHKPLPELPSKPKPILHYSNDYYASAEQEEAVKAIIKVVMGHSKRPLIMTADRGRGKSSAIGIAMIELMDCVKIQNNRHRNIVISAPQRESVNEIFLHAIRCAEIKKIPYQSKKNKLEMGGLTIAYLAPDELLRHHYSIDLLCIDEAAAIPIPLLLNLTQRYTRMLFSTTTNGYEGTGRGFEIRFKEELKKLRPNYRTFEMSQPVRWSEHDPLEQWLSSVFLLKHAHSISGNHDRSLLTPANDSMMDNDEVSFRLVTKEELLTDIQLSQSLFSLLVSAHYQTSPNDWISLLTDPSLECWIGFNRERSQLLACALISLEGKLTEELISDIQLGLRRPRGHLVPVLLTQTLCISEPAQQRCARIMRIAVAYPFQGQHIGSRFIHYIGRHYKKQGIDYLGTSFGISSQLWRFWMNHSFFATRLGITKDKASGSHSLLAVKPLSTLSYDWLDIAKEYFALSFSEQLRTVFSELGTDEVKALLLSTAPFHSVSTSALSPIMHNRIKCYAGGGLGTEMLLYELRTYVLENIEKLDTLSNEQQCLIILKLLQSLPWKHVIEVLKLEGHHHAENKLRDALLVLIDD